MNELEENEVDNENFQSIAQNENYRESTHVSEFSDEGPTEMPVVEFSAMKTTVYGMIIVVTSAASVCANSQFTNIAYKDYNFTATSMANWFACSAFLINYPIIAIILMCFGRNHTDIYREAMLVCGKDGFTLKSATYRMLTMAIMLAVANYGYYYALAFTSPTDVLAVFSSVVGFAYVLSVIWLKEPFIIIRFLAVLLSIAGVVLIAYSEGLGSLQATGVLLTAASAFFSATFRVISKKCLVSISLAQTSMLLTLVGFYSLVTLWIPTLILHLAGIEVLTASSFPWPFFMIGIFNVIYNLLLCIGIAITYPAYASLGSLFAIPMNAAIDVSLRQEIFNLYKILGTLSLILAFLILTIPAETVLAFSSRLRSRITRRQNRQEAPSNDQRSIF
ncbi:uncharacterized protein TRIADDRAFT_60827 [Trichoplax adhaerens]|uniref:EamA domain-containing protein n=1 Tax=Trichoplax adhaerens TaxID=10228 RepID=B3S999_TRIAD|nr:hypothetical protein TRIADDRAFT_60827 [Trichoplax adhaerens]EDV20666.1 hypothetical protein TRIADDRAFT_60827 [Trichoplax adhaerens]|eukprot:XP_002116866.1 hypothetical protein TRIADDRAFT_60827 [Trichoplax adhaerens]